MYNSFCERIRIDGLRNSDFYVPLLHAGAGNLSLEAATAWIEAAPVEPWLEPAFAKYVLSRTATHGPETGVALAEKLQNQELRQDTLALIGRAWFHKDPDAARSWAEGQDFDDERMRMIVAPPEMLFVPPPNKSSRVAPGGEGSGTNPP